MLPRGPNEHVKTGVQFAQDCILRANLFYRLECDSPQIFNVDKDALDERLERGGVCGFQRFSGPTSPSHRAQNSRERPHIGIGLFPDSRLRSCPNLSGRST